MQRYDWPGNVRELRNAIGHAAVVAGGGQIRREDLPESVRHPVGSSAGEDEVAATLAAYLAAVGDRGGDLHAAALGPVERAVIERALRACGGNQTEAARMLGVHRNTLRNKIREESGVYLGEDPIELVRRESVEHIDRMLRGLE